MEKRQDLISRQAAIGAIQKIKGGGSAMRTVLYINAIKDVPSAHQWIPCSERLPDKTNAYIVTDYSGDVYANAIYDNECSREYWRRFVRAWMPLPEPYKEDEA